MERSEAKCERAGGGGERSEVCRNEVSKRSRTEISTGRSSKRVLRLATVDGKR